MEKKKYDLLIQLFGRLQEVDALDKMLVIGSWCMLFYERYFDANDFHSAIRTRDVDLLIPIPFRLRKKINLHGILEELGFVVVFKGRDGYQTFQHPDLILEFLVPERGRGHEGPYDVPLLGVNAQPLRYLDFLTENTILIDCDGLKVRVPHPANFALHKLIVSSRRAKAEKAENDLRQAMEVLRALVDSGEAKLLKSVFAACPAKWRKTIITVLQDEPFMVNTHGEPLAEEMVEILR